MEAVVRYVTLCDGVVYGEYVRDTLRGEQPRNIDAWFPLRADLITFVRMCPDVRNAEYRDYDDRFGVRVSFDAFSMDCIYGPGFSDFDFECNTLARDQRGLSSLILEQHDIRGLMDIMLDVRNGVAKEIKATPQSRVLMWSRGWTIQSKHLAARKIQNAFRWSMACPDYKMCRDRLLREFNSG